MLRVAFVAFCAFTVVALAEINTEDEGAPCAEGDNMCMIRKQLYHITVQLDKLADEHKEKQEVDKRKSTYVRFGKRDPIEEDLAGVEKRKSTYVRFGRSVFKNGMRK